MNIPTGHPISNSSATQKGRIKTAAPSPSPTERPLNPFRLKSQRGPSAAAAHRLKLKTASQSNGADVR